ncbi:KTSC domain-containing protein [Pedobacter sp. AW31-3R]|uniref:KTSC domain-containing protein n=1 Tax=Pedobacter sp. AW31-3R TaxID=3445781 RepID=UPI003F9EEE72
MPLVVIDEFSYDHDAFELTIKFSTGKVYVYKEVPEETFFALQNAGSKGKYFSFYIKDKYKGVKEKVLKA